MRRSFWSKMLFGMAAVLASMGAGAGEYVWTGAQNAFWTNAANWTVGGAVAANPPGWVLARTSGGLLTTNGTPADVAVFGACTSGRTTIDLDGQWKIDSVIFTNGAPAYTLGTSTAKAQYLKLGLRAKVTVAEAVTANQTIQVLSSTYDAAYRSSAGSYTVSLYNHSTTAELVYNGCGRYEGNGVPHYYLYGEGTIRQNGSWSFDRSSGFHLYLTGRFILGETSTDSARRVYCYDSMAASVLGDDPRIIEIPAGCYMNTTGGGWGEKIMSAYANTHVVGAGTILARNQFNSSKYLPELGGNFSVGSGKQLEIDTAIAPTGGGVTSSFPGSIGLFGAGTLLLHGTNTCPGAVRIHESGTLAVTRVGAAGCAAAASCLGTGSEVRFYSNGTLRYVGEAADATDRSLTTTNATSALTITFANGGAGAFTLNSHQKMLLPNALGATLRLKAETAPIVFGGTFEEGQDWKLVATGTAGISFASEPGVPVELAANVRLGLSTTTVLPADLSLDGDVTFAIADDQDLSLARLPVLPDGATLDFALPEGSTVTLPGRSNVRFSNITVNGAAAQTDATGKLVCAETGSDATWTSVTSGGAWSSVANWKDGQKPGALDDVFIANGDAAANSYTITVDEETQVNGITMQEQAGGTVTLGGTKTLTLGSGGYTVLTNTTKDSAKGSAATVVAGGPFNVAAPLHLAASQRWLLGSIRGWGYTSGYNTFSGDLSSEADVTWSILGYGRYCFSSGSSSNYLGTTKVGVQLEFDGTNQFHRLGKNEIHLYRGTVTDEVARAAGTTNTAPGVVYRFKAGEKEATVVNPFRVTGNCYVSGGRNSWSWDETIIAYKWANTWSAFTNRGTRLTLSGGFSGSTAVGYLQFSQAWGNFQPVTSYRCFDPDFGRIVLSGDGSAFAAGTVRTFTMLEIAHANALGPANNRPVVVGSDGYWSQYYPYTVAGVLLRPGLTYSGSIAGTYRADKNGAQCRPATMLLGSAETSASAGATTAVFSGNVDDTNAHNNELRFTAAAGTTAKFTGKITVASDRWKYHGTPDIVARGDVELSNTGNSFGTNLCVRAGGLVLDANAAGKLPIVLGGFVPGAVEVRCADGAAAAHGTIGNVTRDDGTVLYGKKMTFSGAQTVDGVRVQTGDTVLNIYPGMTAAEGIWKVVSDTEWQRIDELDEVDEVMANRGLRAIVREGSTFGGTSHFLVTDPTHFRVSEQYGTGSERLSNSYGAPVFHPDTVANPPVALLTGAATTITNAVTVTDNHSAAPSTIGGKTAESSTFSGPISLAKSVTLAAAEGGTVSFTGRFSGAGDLIGGGAGVSDVTAATIALDATNGFRCASGTLRVSAAQLGTRLLGWIRSTDGDGGDWTETTGLLSVAGDLDLRNRTLSFAGFGKDDEHVEQRLITLATCSGKLTLPADKTVAGSSGRWTLVADGQTLLARHALTGMLLIFR